MIKAIETGNRRRYCQDQHATTLLWFTSMGGGDGGCMGGANNVQTSQLDLGTIRCQDAS